MIISQVGVISLLGLKDHKDFQGNFFSNFLREGIKIKVIKVVDGTYH